jgi:anti-anti-sigma factor
LTTREPDPLTGEFEPFRVDVEPDRESVRVAPVGELDIATVDKLQTEVSRLLETGFAKVVLDLRGVRFLDSTGLRLVLELDAAARAGSHDAGRGAPELRRTVGPRAGRAGWVGTVDANVNDPGDR